MSAVAVIMFHFVTLMVVLLGMFWEDRGEFNCNYLNSELDKL
jgi:hypothetical protein